MYNKAKQLLLNEIRKCKTKAELRRRDAVKLEAEAAELQKQADKLE